jgi:two-component system, chemotaxis family, response regulator WspF
MIKIALANKSQNIIDSLLRVLSSIHDCKVIWAANSCKDTIQKATENPPDLLILDINLPKLGGVEVTRELVESRKCSILLTTSDIGLNAPKIFEALGCGAIDVVNLQSYNFDEDPVLLQNFLRKIDIIFLLIGKELNPKLMNRKDEKFVPKEVGENPPLIVIGASTGGPLALSRVISTFPGTAKFSVIIVQHIDEMFIPSLVSWLNDFSGIPVELALPGASISSGIIYVAAKNQHLIVNAENQFEYVDVEEDDVYAPSIDMLFDSLFEHWPVPATAVLLTGMGNDGASGLKKLYEKKWYTIVQNETTCVVFGMPKVAIRMGGVSEVLPLDEIGPCILRHLGNRL